MYVLRIDLLVGKLLSLSLYSVDQRMLAWICAAGQIPNTAARFTVNNLCLQSIINYATIARLKGGTEVTHLVHQAFNISSVFSRRAKAFGSLDLMIDQTLFSFSAILLAFSAFSFLSRHILVKIFSLEYFLTKVGSEAKMHHQEFS